jgi:hypothetical protein
MTVRGADAHRVGTIKDIHEGEILIKRRLQPTVHVPLKAFVPLIAAVSLLAVALPARMPSTAAAGPKMRTLASYVPAIVAHGLAKLRGPHNPNDVLHLAVALQLRHRMALQRFLQTLDDPASPNYHRFLTQQQFNQQFAPTALQEAAVVHWLQAGGLTVTQTYPNRLLVDVHGTTSQIERLLHIAIDDYRAPLGEWSGPSSAPRRTPACQPPCVLSCRALPA